MNGGMERFLKAKTLEMLALQGFLLAEKERFELSRR